jgi:hypothetical protein
VLSGLYLAHGSIIMAAKYPRMNKEGTAGKRKHATVTVPQKLVIVRGLKVAQAEVWLWLHTMLDSQL